MLCVFDVRHGMSNAAVWDEVRERIKTLERGEAGDRGERRDVRGGRAMKGGSIEGYGLGSSAYGQSLPHRR